jgi:hypothetical protein
LTNIAGAVLDLGRAQIDSRVPVKLSVASDGPAELTLVGRGGRTTTVTVTPGLSAHVVAPSAFAA